MKKWHWIVLAVLTLASIVVSLTMHHSPEHSNFWDTFPVFWALFGFAGCFVLTVFAKIILGKIIYKKEDYYNE